jgi:hypothetical protein
MLGQNIDALYLACALIRNEAPSTYAPEISASALDAFMLMIRRTENALPKFPPGTSQNTLIQNRLRSLREGEARILARMKTEPNQSPETTPMAVTLAASHPSRQPQARLT